MSPAVPGSHVRVVREAPVKIPEPWGQLRLSKDAAIALRAQTTIESPGWRRRTYAFTEGSVGKQHGRFCRDSRVAACQNDFDHGAQTIGSLAVVPSQKLECRCVEFVTDVEDGARRRVERLSPECLRFHGFNPGDPKAVLYCKGASMMIGCSHTYVIG